MKDLYLHRYPDPDKRWHSAMTVVVDGMADTETFDLGLAALVGLLNERASDRLRQVLRPRLPLVTNTDRTALALLIAEVFMPSIINHCGYAAEANQAGHWRDFHDAAEVYRRLGARFTKPDGRAVLVSGCMALATAMEAEDPLAQDILAVSAAGAVVSYEATEGWSDLLHILDYVIGLTDIRPYIGQPMASEIRAALAATEDGPAGLFEGLPDRPTGDEAANFFGRKIAAMARVIGEDKRIGYQPRDCAALLLQVAIGLVFKHGSRGATRDQLRGEVQWLASQTLGAGEAIIAARVTPEPTATPAVLH